VPPKEHRVNAAERAIRTFKNHFVSILCTVDAKFPLTESPPSSSHSDAQFATLFAHSPLAVRIRLPLRELRLQQNATGTSRYKNRRAHLL
jgi:hypothetical protein